MVGASSHGLGTFSLRAKLLPEPCVLMHTGLGRGALHSQQEMCLYGCLCLAGPLAFITEPWKANVTTKQRKTLFPCAFLSPWMLFHVYGKIFSANTVTKILHPPFGMANQTATLCRLVIGMLSIIIHLVLHSEEANLKTNPCQEHYPLNASSVQYNRLQRPHTMIIERSPTSTSLP